MKRNNLDKIFKGFPAAALAAFFMTATLPSCVKKVDVDQVPQQTGIIEAAPLTGSKNTVLNISGNNFPASGIEVKINGKVMPVVASTNNNIQVRVLPGTGTGPVEVSFGGSTYAAGTFNYLFTQYNVTALTNGLTGYVDGPVATARLEEVIGLAIHNNLLYTAQYDVPRVRVINLTTMTVGTLAGDGTVGNVDGQGTAAKLGKHDFISVDATGNVFLADQTNNKIRKITPGGMVSTFASTSFGIQGIKVGKLGSVFVAGESDIAKYSSTGTLVWRVRSKASAFKAGDTSNLGFTLYGGIEVDPTETKVYVLNTVPNATTAATRVAVLDIAANTFDVVPGGGTGSGIQFATDIVRDASGGFYISEYYQHRVSYLKNGLRTTVIGGVAGDAVGNQSVARIRGPHGLAMDAQGAIYVGEASSNNKIKKIVLVD